MKNLWLWLIVAVASIGALLLYLFHKPKSGTVPSQTNPGTASNPASWFGGWAGFTSAANKASNAKSVSAFTALDDLSNAFGLNDGGKSGGVSVGGSGAGGIASSGSGAAPAIDTSAYDSTLFDAETASTFGAIDVSNPGSATYYDYSYDSSNDFSYS